MAEPQDTFHGWELQISGKQVWEALNHLSPAYKRNCLHRVVGMSKSYVTLANSFRLQYKFPRIDREGSAWSAEKDAESTSLHSVKNAVIN